jgi:DNA-binding protein HU-beta
MNKRQLAVVVSKRTGFSRAEVETVIAEAFMVIREQLVADDPVSIKNFGRFEIRRLSGRTYRNPRTGTSVEKPDRGFPRLVFNDRVIKDVLEGRVTRFNEEPQVTGED